MPRIPLESLGVLVRKERGPRKIRETAHEIGIGPATLLRVENGRMPDVETFGKLCRWLKVDPGKFLGFEPAPRSDESEITSELPSSISAHFRADQTPRPETVKALAQMVLYVLKNQPKLPPENA